MYNDFIITALIVVHFLMLHWIWQAAKAQLIFVRAQIQSLVSFAQLNLFVAQVEKEFAPFANDIQDDERRTDFNLTLQVMKQTFVDAAAKQQKERDEFVGSNESEVVNA